MAKLTLMYENVDITKDVDIMECVVRDVSGGESDWVNLKLDHAKGWQSWKPKKNDRIQINRSGYSTKTLYLNTVVIEDGTYRIIATGGKCSSIPARWQSYENKTLANIMSLCAGEARMGSMQYGINGGTLYQYVMRQNETAPVFLDRLLKCEGAVLKSMNERYAAIGVEYAQSLKAAHELNLETGTRGYTYSDRRGMAWASLQIKTPFGSGIARDTGAEGANQIITNLCVDTDAQARRWAKGLLLTHNRQSEILKLEIDFNPGYTAMGRIDIKSKTNLKGQWIIDNVEHDLIDDISRAMLYRCIRTIV